MRSAICGVDGGEDLARQAGTAANVENQGRGGEVEELEGAVSHFGLNVLNTRRCSVLSGFIIIVEEIRRACSICQSQPEFIL